VAAYEYGQDRQALYRVEQTVFYSTSRTDQGGEAYRKNLAKEIAGTLAAPATTATGKKFLCKQLAYIGTTNEIPILASLLTDDKVSHMARYALEQIPAQEVDLALKNALNQTTGTLKIGVVNSLGNRKAAAASDELIALLNDPDPTMVEAAATSLAEIGSKKGARAVAQRLAASKGGLRDNLATVYLRFAFGFQSTGQRRAAGSIYEQLYGAQEKPSVRATALRGLAELGPRRGISLISDALQSDDKTIRQTVVLLARITPASSAAKKLAACLPQLSPEMQVCLIGALAAREDASGIKDVFKGYASEGETTVRATALTALGKINDSSQLLFLLERAAETSGAERQAARDSLARMRVAKIDEQLGAKLATASAEVKIEIVRALAARNAKKSIDTLIKAAGDKDSKVRIEAWRALGEIGDDKRLGEMVDLLEKAYHEGRADAEEAVLKVLRQVPAGQYPAAMILKKIEAAPGKEVKLSLLRTLASAGDDRTLDTLRAAAKDADADTRDVAIRGLCAWPTPAVIDDLRAQARTGDTEVYRVLALSGCLRLLPLLPNRTPQDRLALLTAWSKLVTHAAEKRAILGQMGDYSTLAAMQMALPFLKDQETANEAGLTIVKIAQTLKATQPAAVRTAMQQVIGAARNDQVVKSADVILREVAEGLNPAPAPAPGLPMVSGPPEFKWVKLDTTFALMNREAVVWQWNYAPPEAKPYFHPVALVNGTLV
jgi:HEAT repeat protein